MPVQPNPIIPGVNELAQLWDIFQHCVNLPVKMRTIEHLCIKIETALAANYDKAIAAVAKGPVSADGVEPVAGLETNQETNDESQSAGS